MNVCLICGSPKGKKSNTYDIAMRVVKNLKEYDDVEITEFFANKDFPNPCTGCFSCFLKGEEKCPHRDKVEPIYNGIMKADVILMLTPVYVMSCSAQMKALLDHFGYMFSVHRPRMEMVQKSAMVITTTAGAGLNKGIAPVAESLKHWGIPKTLKLGLKVFGMSFDDASLKKQKKIDKICKSKAKALYKDIYAKKRKSLHTRLMMFIMKDVIKNFDESHVDRIYWVKNNWI